MNVAMTDAGAFVEVQGTAEAGPFDRAQLDAMLALAERRHPSTFRAPARCARRSCRLIGSSSKRSRPRSAASTFAISALRRAQAALERALAEGDPSPRIVEAYLAAARRYFGGFAREAQSHLADVERRLARASQLQYNLTAERGVAARRIEATQGVLARVEELAGE